METREFDIMGIPVTMGHDRDTRKRYICIEAVDADMVAQIIYTFAALPVPMKAGARERALAPSKREIEKAVKPIFWLK